MLHVLTSSLHPPLQASNTSYPFSEAWTWSSSSSHLPSAVSACISLRKHQDYRNQHCRMFQSLNHYHLDICSSLYFHIVSAVFVSLGFAVILRDNPTVGLQLRCVFICFSPSGFSTLQRQSSFWMREQCFCYFQHPFGDESIGACSERGFTFYNRKMPNYCPSTISQTYCFLPLLGFYQFWLSLLLIRPFVDVYFHFWHSSLLGCDLLRYQ